MENRREREGGRDGREMKEIKEKEGTK